MIITHQVKHLLGFSWQLNEISSEHVRFILLGSDDYFIEIEKQTGRRESNSKIFVTIPLEHVKYTTCFQNEMPAYEYIEDFIYDVMEKGIESGDKLIEKKRSKKFEINNNVKRRRLTSTSCFDRMESDLFPR
tara:strand:- start:87 stop:482 length:396 start_codon:yes stop_codon:yes gene_type:complete